MTKLLLEPGRVMNLGGYIVESRAQLPYRDVVIGNPQKEPVKITAPVIYAETLEEYKMLGIIVEPVAEGESLVKALKKVEHIIEKKAGKSI